MRLRLHIRVCMCSDSETLLSRSGVFHEILSAFSFHLEDEQLCLEFGSFAFANSKYEGESLSFCWYDLVFEDCSLA